MTVSLECIQLHRCRCNNVFSRVLNRLNFSNKIRPAVALRGAHQETFFHAVLAHTGNNATKFQGISGRLAALTLVTIMIFLSKVVSASRRSPSNGVRKVSASFPTTLALLVGSYLLTSARQASNPSPSLLVRTIFNAFPWQKRISAERSLLQHSSAQHSPIPRDEDPIRPQWPHLQVVPPLN